MSHCYLISFDGYSHRHAHRQTSIQPSKIMNMLISVCDFITGNVNFFLDLSAAAKTDCVLKQGTTHTIVSFSISPVVSQIWVFLKIFADSNSPEPGTLWKEGGGGKKKCLQTTFIQSPAVKKQYVFVCVCVFLPL